MVILLRLILIGLMGILVLASAFARARREDPPGDRERFDRLFAAGNYKEAYEGYRRLALDAKAEPGRVGGDLARAIECLEQLGRTDEVDALRDAVIALHGGNWRLLHAAAETLLDGVHDGYLVAGAFRRGSHRGGGHYAGSFERDRARALQLLVRGLDRARGDADRAAAGRYLLALARAAMGNRAQVDPWRLQALTPLDVLPDYDDSDAMFPRWRERTGAPVEPDGTPVYYRIPAGFAHAKNDGERWRWALAQAAEADPGLLDTARSTLAGFLADQFGTQTIGGPEPAEGPSGPADRHRLETLTDDETVARLATGVRRFRLPDEFNFIKVYGAIADGPKSDRGERALAALAAIFQGRRQFDRAADYWKRSRRIYGEKDDIKTRRIDQILGAWGEFEGTRTQPAGRRAAVDFRFRNGRRVHFEAHELLPAKLLEDVQAEIAAAKPAGWRQFNINDIGRRVVARDERKYLGKSVASWDLDLDPLPGHFDRRITVNTPLEKAGAYLLTARMEDGNTSRIVVWLDDTAIVERAMSGQTYYFIADARTGRPVPRADVRLFGWCNMQVRGRNEWRVESRTLTLRADDEGQLRVPGAEQTSSYQWAVIATTPDGRLAYQGFESMWRGSRVRTPDKDTKVYAITDRPVYRPGGPVKFKVWVAFAQYDQADASAFAGKPFQVEVRDPRGEKVYAGTFTADAFGGFDGSFELSSDAALGVYRVEVPRKGGGTFRVEEYKKPEFEVKVEAPSTPVKLGDKVAATIKAEYYFGGPVAEAKVWYKVTRTSADARWYPASRWDWLFGAGYWWFAADSPWYPGWSRWGMGRPVVRWGPHAEGPPEVVAEAELPIRPDGTIAVEIDTAAAREAHPDQDHRYEITAEVTDPSRRTIVGTGTVLVARRPFAVYTWVDRGHYRAGDTIEAGVRAMTLDHKPVAGKGTLKLLKVTYDAEGRPVEAPAATWEIALDADGQARQAIKAAEAGQYRLSATIDDGRGNAIEGGYLLTVTGAGFDGTGFRFNDIEVIPERKEYRPGEKLRLLINANRPDATVLLFVRAEGGVYPLPRMLRLQGKSTVAEVGIVPRDMPNIFVEALTIADGKVHVDTREIAVPPESRVVDVTIEPSQTTYKPGQKAAVKLKLTGPDGKPFTGSTVLAVYDKAVEAIPGGSNVPEIKAFFWKWKRSHDPQANSSLDRSFGNLTKPNEVPMYDLESLGELALGDLPVPMPAGMAGGIRRLGMEPAAELSAILVPMAGAPAAPAEGTQIGKSLDSAAVPPVAPGESGPQVEPVIRTNFADTAFWAAALSTGPDGIAEVDFPMPESLTTWKVRSWAMGPGTRVGQGEAEILTTKDLLVRLQAPRFFVEKDEVVLSANVHNKLRSRKSVQVILECDGSVLEPMDEPARTVAIDAGSEHRVDWRVRVVHEGKAVIRMKAMTDEESDAAQMSFPAYVHGMLRTESFSGTIRPDQDSARVVVNVPAERKPEQSRLEVRFSPTLAGALVDALPYLADYPYGCTEQTLNRFLPSVIAQKVLLDLGLDLKAIRAAHTNLNAQELGDARDRAKKWMGYRHNPAFDEAELAKRTAAGLRRLADMQLSDGGWGWFSGSGERSSAHTTALVVHGLQTARQSGVEPPAKILERGVAWLADYQAEQVRQLGNAESQTRPYKSSADDTDALVFMVLADAGTRDDRMPGLLDRDRAKLSVYGKTLFGLALQKLGDEEKLMPVLRNIAQYVVKDDENQTAYLKLPNEGYWWWWYGSEIETHAFYLKLLARTDPKGDLAPRLVKYLLNNRRHGSYWNSTRDTAFCVEAMAEYLKASGEDRPDMTIAIAIDGQTRKEVRITPAELFRFDNGFVVEGEALSTGEHAVSLTRKGRGPVYFNAYLTNFTMEDPIPRAGLEIRVDRKVYQLLKDDKVTDVAGGRGQLVGQRVERYRREPMADGATFKSGDLVDVELEIDSKNDYEYLVFEDFKAAGFEPVEVRSGYNGNDLGAYVEFRDERVAFFARALARGQHSVSYRLRAEVPGRFHALPARAQAMYAPELRGNSDEIRLGVED